MEATRLEEEERLQQKEIVKLDQQLEQKRLKLREMEEMETQLKAELKSLTRREGGSSGGVSRDRHQFGQQSPNSSLLHLGHPQGQQQSQQSMRNNLPDRPGVDIACSRNVHILINKILGPMSSAFYKGMRSHSPAANSFLGGLDSSRR